MLFFLQGEQKLNKKVGLQKKTASLLMKSCTFNVVLGIKNGGKFFLHRESSQPDYKIKHNATVLKLIEERGNALWTLRCVAVGGVDATGPIVFVVFWFLGVFLFFLPQRVLC